MQRITSSVSSESSSLSSLPGCSLSVCPRRDQLTVSPIGVALVLFGVLYTVALTEGRGSLGLSVLPRYAIFELLILVGCYLAVLDGSLFQEREGRIARVGRHISIAGVIGRLEGTERHPTDGRRYLRMDHIVSGLPSSSLSVFRYSSHPSRRSVLPTSGTVKSWPPPTSPSTSTEPRIRWSESGSARRGNQFRSFGTWLRWQGPNI